MSRSIDRRGFIKALAATVALGPGAALARSAGVTAAPETILLSSRSRLRPHLSANLAAGLRLGLQQEVRLLEQRPGMSGLRSAAGKLVRGARSQQLLAWQHPGMTSVAGPLVQQLGQQVLLLSAGENVPRDSERHAAVTSTGLGQWLTDHALGRWAAAAANGPAVLLTSLYDSGYDLVAAYRAGFESGGGTVASVLLTDSPHGVPATVAHVLSHQPGVVHVLHSGRESGRWLRELKAAGVPLVTASSLTLDDSAPSGIHSASAWLPQEPELTEAFRQSTGAEPDEFAAFGLALGRQLAAGPFRSLGHDIQLFRTGQVNGRPGRHVLTGLADTSGTDSTLTELAAAPRSGWVTPWLVG